MKASQLIAILAKHLNEHGDHEVEINTKANRAGLTGPFVDAQVTNCWFNYGKDWGKPDRIIISGNEKD